MKIEIFDVTQLKKTAGVYRFNLRLLDENDRVMLVIHGFRYDRASQDFMYPSGFKFATVAAMPHPLLRERAMEGLNTMLDEVLQLEKDQVAAAMKAARMTIWEIK